MSKEDNIEKEENTAEQANSESKATEQEETKAESEEKKSTENAESSWEEKFTATNDKYLRLYSEFDNFRKRTMKEKADLISSANASLIKDLLPVLDDFERAIASNEKSEDVDGLKEGFLLIYNKFHNIMKSKGVKHMDSKGEPFDMDVHEAVTNIPVENDEEKGKVVDVIEKGYYLNDKVIRYAKVVVGQ
jgi:molecular chaperone GrpE